MPAQTRPTTVEGWLTLARQRILNILTKRVAATVRQLEVKISESGPAAIRPQPHILSGALSQLQDEGLVRRVSPRGESKGQQTPFYTLSIFWPEPASSRIQDLLVYYRLHRMLADRPEYCSRVLEDIVTASFADDERYQFLGRLPKDRPLDAVFSFTGKRNACTVGIEVKNVREWLYPHSPNIWPLLSKCAELDALPILIARKVGFLTKQMFSSLGVLRLEVHRQVFSPLVQELLTSIQHTDRLGYKDVVARPAGLDVHIARFATVVAPTYTDEYISLWRRHRELIIEYADRQGLADPKLDSRKRERALRKFLQELEIPHDVPPADL